MASSIGSKIPQLIVGAAAISALGLSTIATIRNDVTPAALDRAAIFTGDTYLVTSEDSTPSVLLDNESTPILSYPTSLGTEHCIGNTGALLCEIAIKLTGSGGHKNHNAGSWVCTTYSCAVLSSDVFVEANPAGQNLWVGWSTSPGTTSGAQIINRKTTASGGMIVGSGSYTEVAGVTPVNGLVIPPGATAKAIWQTGLTGDRSEDYSAVKALWITRYRKFYNP